MEEIMRAISDNRFWIMPGLLMIEIPVAVWMVWNLFNHETHEKHEKLKGS